MTSRTTQVPNAIGRVAAVAVVAAALSTLAVAPAAAKPARDRSAKASTSVQDVSGLQVVRTWKIAAEDPATLTAAVHVENTNTAPVTTTILEPLPTDSLEKVKFTPKKVAVTQTPGLARVDLTIPSGGEVDFGYTAVLTKDRKANAQDRLAAVQGEMEATLATAQAADADKALAAHEGPVCRTGEGDGRDARRRDARGSATGTRVPDQHPPHDDALLPGREPRLPVPRRRQLHRRAEARRAGPHG